MSDFAKRLLAVTAFAGLAIHLVHAWRGTGSWTNPYDETEAMEVGTVEATLGPHYVEVVYGRWR